MTGGLTLALAGDVMLGRLVNQTIAAAGFAYPWGDLLPTLHSADLFLVNLECALTAHTDVWHEDGTYKTFYFRAEPSVVETLTLGRVDFACLANNHAADFGMAGLLETAAVLDRAGIAHAGAGADLRAARAPAVLDARGWRVAVVAFADQLAAWAATPTTPGINYTPISTDSGVLDVVRQALAAARRLADLVVFTIHWGPNMRPRPTPAFRAFAHAVVEAGADLFWGHSAHVVQGIEVWRGTPILYDTGDFVDDYAVDGTLRNDLSALFLVHVRPPVVERVELVPVCINRMQVNLAAGAEHDWLARRVAALCGELGTTVTVGPRGVSVPVTSADGARSGSGREGATTAAP